jgi:TonB family protein
MLVKPKIKQNMHTKLLPGLLFAIASTSHAQEEPRIAERIEQERREMKRPVTEHIRDNSPPSFANAPGIFEPRYPLEQLLHGEGGVVRVQLRLDEETKVVETGIAQSTGNKILDTAAERTVRQWIFSWTPKKHTAGIYEVPIEFHSIIGKAATSYDGIQAIPLVTYNDRSKKNSSEIAIQGESNQLNTIKEARDYLAKACNTIFWEKDENIIVYKEFDGSGLNVWSIFEPEGRFGPSIVRRTLSNRLGQLYVTTSFICEADQESCRQLREYLDAGFSTSAYRMPGVFGVPKKLKSCRAQYAPPLRRTNNRSI